MLKQVFDKEQLSKALTSSDVWHWDLLTHFGNVEKGLDHTVRYWKSNNLSLSSLERKTIKKKSVFIPTKMEDAFAIKLLDRFVRKIYKVRQSDRNRIIRQLITLLKDSGNYHILRMDIKDCYETIPFEKLINKFEKDLILAPRCIKLLKDIHNHLQSNYDVHGLPRGLSISPTLAEIYLESFDKKLKVHPYVIYNARYVDDIIVVTPAGMERNVQSDITNFIIENGLNINDNIGKYYSGPLNSAEFDYLGYFIKAEPITSAPNKVYLTISKLKLDKIKSRIAISFVDYKKQKNILLLKRRLEYLSMLKIVKKGKNGHLLAGLAHNYQYVTDGFECLKTLDGFICHQLTNPRYGMSWQEQEKIKKISIYGNVKKRNIGKFSKKKVAQIMRIWKNV